MKETKYSCDWCGAEVKGPDHLSDQRVSDGVHPPFNEEICDACVISLRNGIFKIRAKMKDDDQVFDYSPGAMKYYKERPSEAFFVKDCEVCGMEIRVDNPCPYCVEQKVDTVMYFQGRPALWWVKLKNLAENIFIDGRCYSRSGVDKIKEHLK